MRGSWDGAEKHERQLFQHEVEKNRRFNEELRQRGLCLAVARTWGNRTLSTDTAEWQGLRSKVMQRDDWTCRFCGLRSLKYMICDHMDGDASNNSLENLGVNCPLCDLIRHCGRAGVNGYLSLWKSELTQVEIVKRTQNLWRKTGAVPDPRTVDPKAAKVADTTIDFANLLLRRNYSQLSEEQLSYRGFFELPSAAALAKVIPISAKQQG